IGGLAKKSRGARDVARSLPVHGELFDVAIGVPLERTRETLVPPSTFRRVEVRGDRLADAGVVGLDSPPLAGARQSDEVCAPQHRHAARQLAVRDRRGVGDELELGRNPRDGDGLDDLPLLLAELRYAAPKRLVESQATPRLGPTNAPAHDLL